MNAYFFKMTNEERNNILDQHKEVYDGYVTSYAQPEKEQPLYTQSYANDKGGINVNNRGEVSTYSNLRINEMRHDGKSTGLFSDEEPKEQGHISPGSQFDTTETFESEDKDGEHYVSLGERLDTIGDGPKDLDHGTFEDDDSDMILVSPEFDDNDDEMGLEDEMEMDFEDSMSDMEGGETDESWAAVGRVAAPMVASYVGKKLAEDEEDFVFDNDSEIFNDIDQDEVEGLFDDLKESLDMFKRFTKYN
jgi:hypothetical protein